MHDRWSNLLLLYAFCTTTGTCYFRNLFLILSMDKATTLRILVVHRVYKSTAFATNSNGRNAEYAYTDHVTHTTPPTLALLHTHAGTQRRMGYLCVTSFPFSTTTTTTTKCIVPAIPRDLFYGTPFSGRCNDVTNGRVDHEQLVRCVFAYIKPGRVVL